MRAYDITEYGAKGDGVTDNTKAIAATIAACSEDGGGTVRIPAGTYLTGPIVLRSNMTLFVEAGALVLFRNEFDAYYPVETRWSGYECYGFSPLIYGSGLENVSIRGEGCFDGQGTAWWDIYHLIKKGKSYETTVTKKLATLNAEKLHMKTNLVEWNTQFLRPPLLQLYNCHGVTLEGITLQNSPFWNTHLVYCDHVNVRGVTFKNPSNTPNGDGFDIDSCSNVRVSDCHFDVGDDCLCLKSGINEDGRRVGRPTENVTVTNCTMSRGHGGVVFGSENSGGIRNVTVSNCVFIGTDRGIRIKTNRARGAYIENILVNNIYMQDVFCPLAINSFYRYGIDEDDPLMTCAEAIPVTEKTPRVKNIQISNVTAKNCLAAAGFIYGLPELPIEDVSIRHMKVEMTTDANEVGGEPDMVKEEVIMAGEGIFCKHVRGIEFHQVQVETRQGPAVIVEQGEDVELNHVGMKKPHANTPVVKLTKVDDVYIFGRQAVKMKEAYADFVDSNSDEVTFAGN
ncbi:glycoside hydrolase family 28 protein [Halalkalibacter alkaliphilus]|uniref:Glycoside hydrolase family 28 protein n=1 Tax=Halalkalibacter alkaliphilus TaxID=2917993 RepID=A0A9X2CUD5_9BACI|nr:glycoside hydrolase family 28 protein [Halalkalibacter alkaliphilus]MCL7748247.1 glycoside hydrolase family 28 protein [Halalkalibacter alkaliphilus]